MVLSVANHACKDSLTIIYPPSTNGERLDITIATIVTVAASIAWWLDTEAMF